MISTFQRWRLQRWREASLWTTKKIRRQRIRGILEDQSQTQEELTESLEVTQQAVSIRLRAMGMIQKQGNWVPYELKSRDVEKLFFTCEQLIQRQRFFASWLEMRSGYSTTTPRKKNITLSSVNRCHRPQHQHDRTFMIRRLCSVSDGIKRVLFTMSCWNLAIPLRAIGVSATIDPCITRKTVGIWTKTW